MTNFLLRRFVPDYQNTADPAVREKYGNLAGIVGIICNVLLFAGKTSVAYSRIVLVGAWLLSIFLLPVTRRFCRHYFGRFRWWGTPLVSSGRTARRREAPLRPRADGIPVRPCRGRDDPCDRRGAGQKLGSEDPAPGGRGVFRPDRRRADRLDSAEALDGAV